MPVDARAILGGLIVADNGSEPETMSEPTYWIIVGSPENFVRTRELGFTVQGIKSRHRKKAERMQSGDKIAWYITGLKAFAGVATITSTYVEAHDRIWASGDPGKASEDYPYRVQIEADVVLDEGRFVDAEPIARQMEYARKWPAANWTLAFQGNVHVVSESDFTRIRDAIAVRHGQVAA